MSVQNYNYINNGVSLVPRLLPSITASARAKYKDDNRIKKVNKNLTYDRRNGRAACKKRSQGKKTPENLNYNTRLGNKTQENRNYNTRRINKTPENLNYNTRRGNKTPENLNYNTRRGNKTPENLDYNTRQSPPCNELSISWNNNEKDFMQLFQPNQGTTNLSSQNRSTLYNSNTDSGNSSHVYGREGGGCVSENSNDLNSINNNSSGSNIYNGSGQMSSDSMRGVLAPSLRNSVSPTPPYPQALPGSLICSNDKLHSPNTENNNNNRKYSGSYGSSDNNSINNPKYTGPYGTTDNNTKTSSLLNVTSTSLGKDNAWDIFQNKNQPGRKVVFANGAVKGSPGGGGVGADAARRRSSSTNTSTCSRCFSLYHSASINVKNKWTLLLLFHCSLFLVLALYLALGVTILFEIDEGTIHTVRGRGEDERASTLRTTAAERLLNISLKAVLERSRDSVLDTIFMSDEMQAALMAFKTSRLSILPSDHKLELLSNDVLNYWRRRLEEVLLKYHLITTLEAQGHQLTQEELQEIWDQPLIVLNQNNVFTHSKLDSVQWKPWSGSIQAFGLLTTMGVDTLSPSHGGRAFTVIYTLFGFPLYFCIIAIWSRRFFNVLKIISKGRGPSKIRNGTSTDEMPVHTWNSTTQLDDECSQSENKTLLIFISLLLSIVYIIGIGPLVCGSLKNSFGERLEAAFLSLFLVKPPTPLPEEDGEKCCGFIVYVIIGHFIIGATILSLNEKLKGSEKFEDNITRRR